MVCHSKFSNS